MSDNEQLRYIVYLIHLADRLHQHCIDRRLQDIGMLRNQHQILMYLHHHRDNVSQRQIADRFGVSGAAVTFALNTLEKSGFIVRSPSSEDGRRNVITLSDKGERIVEKTHRECEYVDSSAFCGMDEADMQMLSRSLERICDNLKNATPQA